jgi:uncharacterized protein (TIGR02996 family)
MTRHRPAAENEEAGLLDAIHASPREDAPRLVYADWLEDHGQAEYAVFIRLQVARAAQVGVLNFYRGEGNTVREYALAGFYGQSWARPVARLTKGGMFLRGLPLVQLRSRAYAREYPDDLVARSSARARFEVELTAWVRRNLDSEILARTAVLWASRCTEKDIRLIASCPHLGGIELVGLCVASAQARQLCEELLIPRVPVWLMEGP